MQVSSRFLRPLSLVLFIVLISSTVHAQLWTKLGYIPNEKIYSLYFFNEFGHPEWALAGTGTALYRSSDNGFTWSKVLNVGGRVQAIKMKDRDNGWIAVGNTTSTVYVTHTTGAAWQAIGSLPGLADDIEYNPTNGRLFVSILTGTPGSFVSTNEGVTWTKFSTDLMNGFAFSGPKTGVLTPWGGNTVRTTDGGLNWITTTFNKEVYEPVGLKGTTTFFAADDNVPDIYRSNDGGATWRNVYTLPERSTGCMQGTACALYVQCWSQMYASYDEANWQPIGGPGNKIDTRFQVYQNLVYAGDDTGAVWRFVQQDLPPSNLAVAIDRPTVKDTNAIGCAPDTAWVTITNVGCDTEIVQTLDIADSSIWKMQRIALPDTLLVGQTIRIRLIANNPHPGSYPSDVSLSWRLQVWGSDTTFTLLYDVKGIRKPTIAPLALNFKDRCTIIDTFVTIRNEQCDTVLLSKVAIDDSTVFHLNTSALPLSLIPGQSYKVPVHIVAPVKGTYTGKVSVTIKDLGFTLDTIITIALDVKGNIPFKVPVSFTKDMGKTSICGFKESSFSFANTACDTLTLITAEIAAPMRDFSLKGVPTLPLKISPGNADSFKVHFETQTLGGQQVTVHLQFVLDGVLHDTSFTVTATGAQTLEANASANQLIFTPITACQTTEQSYYVRNVSCYAVQLTELQLQNGSRFKVLSPGLPQTIPAGDSIKVTVQFIGSKPIQNVSEQLDAILKDSTQQVDVRITLAGSITPGTRVMQLSTTSVVADSLEPCSTYSSYITIKNLGFCDSLDITSITFSGGGGFVVNGNPSDLGVNDTLQFQLTGPTTAGTTIDGLIHIQGNGIDTTIAVHLSVKNAGLPDAILSSATQNITAHSCQQQTIYVKLHNPGCVTLDVATSSISSGSSQYTIASNWSQSAFSVAAGADTTISLLFDPTNSGDGTGTLLVTLKDGTKRTISFTATIIPLHSARLFLAASSGATLLPKAGASTSARLTFADDVDASDGLTEVRIILNLDQDFLTVRQANGKNGWTITPESGPSGTYQFLARRANATAITAGDELATLDLAAYVTSAMSTDMQLTAAHFMPDVPNYEKCTLAPLTTPVTHIEFALDPECGDRTISNVLGKRPILAIKAITPNPAGKDGVAVEFDAQVESATLEVLDITGHVVYNATLDVKAHTTNIPTDRLPSGTYHVAIKSEAGSVSQAFVVKK